MASKDDAQIIAIEEHYFDQELAAHFEGRNDIKAPPIRERLDDLGDLRLKEMDEAGIDVQVLSHGAPSTQRLDPENRRPSGALGQRQALRPPFKPSPTALPASPRYPRPIPRPPPMSSSGPSPS